MQLPQRPMTMPMVMPAQPAFIDSATGSRKKFTPDEDELLRRLVLTHGDKAWNEIASLMRGRTARQVRERYQHYLSPTVNVGSWSSEEDALLLQMFEVYGPQWSILKQFFNGRSCVNIKNHWTTLVAQAQKTAWEHRTKSDQSGEASPMQSPIEQPRSPPPMPPKNVTIISEGPRAPVMPSPGDGGEMTLRRRSSGAQSGEQGDPTLVKRPSQDAGGDGALKLRRTSSTNIPFGSEVSELSYGYTGFDDVFGEFVW